MSWRLDEVGGAFIQGESEIASVNMVFAATALGAAAATRRAGGAAWGAGAGRRWRRRRGGRRQREGERGGAGLGDHVEHLAADE